MSNDAPSAGWYPNPDGTGGLRWWSGVGWTQYTRSAPATAVDTGAANEPPALPQQQPAADVQAGTEQPGTSETQAWPEQQPATDTQALPTPTDSWQAPGASWQAPGYPAQGPTPPLGGYAPYSPPPAAPLTPSGMRPLGSMFSDIGRITRRAWWPILGISVAIWALVTAALAIATVTLIDIPAFRRALDGLGAALDANPDGSLSQEQLDRLSADFGDAFSRLPVAGWIMLGAVFGVLMLLTTSIQIGAVNRLAMDASAGSAVTWGGAWRSGFTAGFRLFGYYLLIMLLVTIAVLAVTVLIALAAQIAPALAVALGLLAFLGSIVVAVWLTGRLVPALAQAVVSGRALRWSWRATRGKFFAVLGRYLLWSLAASVIINVVVTVVSVPVSLVFLGQATSGDQVSQMGLALTLNLVLLPLSMALTAVTIVGIVPIWRDLSDHRVYRSIDDQGNPIPAPQT